MKKRVITFILTLMGTLVALFIIPSFWGYHLVYLQKYSFDLDSLEKVCSIIFGFLGTIGTVSAVLIAIRIPKKIAEQQNKIALFDKRIEYFLKMESLSTFIESMSSIDNNLDFEETGQKIINLFSIYFLSNYDIKTNELTYPILVIYFNKIISTIATGEFIFDKKDFSRINDLFKSTHNMLMLLYKKEKDANELFTEIAKLKKEKDCFLLDYIYKLQKELKL